MATKTPLYRLIARSFGAMLRCRDAAARHRGRLNDAETDAEKNEAKSQLDHWEKMTDIHEDSIITACAEHLPSGSGFDNGTSFCFDSSRPNRLVFRADFHHMDDHGGYCGWSDHNVVVTPDLSHGFTLRITGINRRDIKDYIAETFHSALTREV